MQVYMIKLSAIITCQILSQGSDSMIYVSIDIAMKKHFASVMSAAGEILSNPLASQMIIQGLLYSYLRFILMIKLKY